MRPDPLEHDRLEHDPVRQGPRAYRSRVRRVGPLVALLPPTILGLIALTLLHENASASRGVMSFVLGVFAAPMLLVFGVPLSHGGGTYMRAILTSAVLWLAIGAVASLRATRSPAASWLDYWREYLWLAAGLWSGVLGALVAADLVLGRSLI